MIPRGWAQETDPPPDGSAMLDSRGDTLRFQGDLDQIRKNRILKVLVSLNRTNFFIVSDQPHGFEYEMLKQYEKFLNRDLSRRDMHTTIVFVPVTAQRLIPLLLEGHGDMAAAMLTITPERQEQVSFTRPYLTGVRQIVVGNRETPPLKRTDDLAGRHVYVRKDSAYVTSLKALNQSLINRGLDQVSIVEVDHLESEDILELINAGGLSLTVVDDYLARFWGEVMDNLVVFSEVALDNDGEIAWAVPKQNVKLLEDLNLFIAKNRKGTLIGNVLFNRYYQDKRWVTNPFARVERTKMDHYIGLFKKYGKRYDFDWFAIAALSYQESMFDHSLVSPVGAIGLMQVTKSTASDKSVGIENIHEVENNIHAGVRYMDWIRRNYFDEPGIEPDARVDFTLAAYNAGPTRIKGLRRKARELGYDPNVWFGNVEQVALKEIGQETVQYVVNISKYYVMFKLAEENLRQRADTKAELLEK